MPGYTGFIPSTAALPVDVKGCVGGHVAGMVIHTSMSGHTSNQTSQPVSFPQTGTTVTKQHPPAFESGPTFASMYVYAQYPVALYPLPYPLQTPPTPGPMSCIASPPTHQKRRCPMYQGPGGPRGPCSQIPPTAQATHEQQEQAFHKIVKTVLKVRMPPRQTMV